MRVHEVVIVVAMLFAGSNLAGAMARRDAPSKDSKIRPAATPAAVENVRAAEVAGAEANPCARTADYQFRCHPARPRVLDGRRMHEEQHPKTEAGDLSP